MHRYKINTYWSEEDQVFIAKVPELPGCMTHGDTRATARANANEAIQAWIDTAKEFGDPVPKPRSERITFNSLAKAKYGITSGHRTPLRRNNPRSFAPARASKPTMNPEAHLK